VAVRAVQHLLAPPLGDPGHVGQLVDQPGRDEQPSGEHRRPVRQLHPEPPARTVQALRSGDLAGDDPAAVTGDLGPAEREQLAGGVPSRPR